MLKFNLGGSPLAAGSSKILFAALLLCLLITTRGYARKHETGFLDRTLVLQGVTYKYQVFVPEDWTPRQPWPVILFPSRRRRTRGRRTARNRGGHRHGNSEEPRRDSGNRCYAAVSKELLVDDASHGRRGHDRIGRRNKRISWGHEPHLSHRYIDGRLLWHVWHLAAAYPGRFAALVVICGM